MGPPGQLAHGWVWSPGAVTPTRLGLDGGTLLGAGGLVREAGALQAWGQLTARGRLTSQGGWHVSQAPLPCCVWINRSHTALFRKVAILNSTSP